MISTRKTLIANFSALTIVQITSYILPLLVFPYLLRVIGPARFGVLSFAQAIVFYFTLIPDLGTNLYAPREIALLRESKEKLFLFVSGILKIKSILLCVALIFYVFIVVTVPLFRREVAVFLFSAGYMVANTFMPIWFFQGIEKMTTIAMGFFVARLLSVVFIFILIRDANDYIYVPLINSGGLIIGLLIMYYSMFFREGIRYVKAGKGMIEKILQESFPLFVSNIAMSVYTSINTVVLGFLGTDVAVGYYAAAEKLIKAGIVLQSQIGNVFYPYTSRMLKICREKGLAAIQSGFVVTMLFAIPATIFVITYSGTIIGLMCGKEFGESVLSLRMMGVLFFLIGLSNVFGIQILLPFGKTKELMRPTVVAGILNLVLLFVLIPLLNQLGAAIAFVLTEVVVSVWMGFEVKKLSLKVGSRSIYIRLASFVIGLSITAIILSEVHINEIVSIVSFCCIGLLFTGVFILIEGHSRSMVS